MGHVERGGGDGDARRKGSGGAVPLGVGRRQQDEQEVLSGRQPCEIEGGWDFRRAGARSQVHLISRRGRGRSSTLTGQHAATAPPGQQPRATGRGLETGLFVPGREDPV